MTDTPTKTDGGAAFPDSYMTDMGLTKASPGMSLRDWFAGQALTVIEPKSVKDYELVAMFGPHRTGIKAEEIAAALAYRIADAMLAARKQGEQG